MRTEFLPWLGVLAIGSVLLGGCGAATAEPSGDGGGGERVAAQPREVGVYSAVIRQLVTEDHTFGDSATPFDHVYVVDAAIEDASDPMASGNEAGEPFDNAVKQGIRQQLTDLPPLTFVSDPDSVRRGEQGMGGVLNNGVIITLEPIDGNGHQVEVGNSLWCGGLCGQWQTYVVELDQDAWHTTGTTGPAAIS